MKYQKICSIIIIVLMVPSTVMVTAYSEREQENQDMYELQVDIFFDKSSSTTEKLVRELKELLDKASLTYQCKSLEILNRKSTATDSKYQIYVFHGSEEGLMLNQKTYSWDSLSYLLKRNEAKHQYLLSCYSSNINKFLDYDLFSLDGEVDYMCAYISFLLALQEDIKEDNSRMSKVIFEEAITYTNKNKYNLLDRLITPLESLSFNCLKSETSVQYGALLPTIRLLKDGTRALASIIAYSCSGAALTQAAFRAIFNMFVSTMYPGFFGYLLTMEEWETWVQEIFAEVDSQEFKTEGLEGAVTDLVADLLPDIVTLANDALGSTIVADILESISFVNSMTSILVTVYSFSNKDWDFNYVPLSDGVAQDLDIETYNEVTIYYFTPTGDSLYEKLEDLEDAIINNYNNIDSKLDVVCSKLDSVLSNYNALTFPDDLDDRFYLWYDLADATLDDIDTTLLPYIDTHAYTNTYIEMIIDNVEGGWWGGNIHIYYHFSNLGGNQVPLSYFRVD
ncbi:MAG: hypothetical protein GOP50_00720 [Candidatus Heimdallarchaeota archaeon]|nr:hypothetical protein [Candidatus Heimdallarchaeota archaeon]